MQYFSTVVNTDKNEYVEIPVADGYSLTERLVGENPLPGAVVTFLQTDGSVSGTLFCRKVNERGADNTMFARKHTDKTNGVKISDTASYAGRWAGESVYFIGDESQQFASEIGFDRKEIGDSQSDWTDITTGVYEEIAAFAGSEFVRENVNSKNFLDNHEIDVK